MHIPDYWAEARAVHPQRGRHVTVRRFGWSDISQEEAQQHAQARADEALQNILSGASLPRFDRRVPYNGAEGVPIREEVLQRYASAVVTRNSYGAHCLNCPDLLIIDIDLQQQVSCGLALGLTACLWVVASVVSIAIESVEAGVLLAFAAPVIVGLTAGPLVRAFQALQGGAEALAARRTRRFLEQRPDWNLRLYKTPVGLRLIATHRKFDPSESEVAECFKSLRADPVYARMCLRQQCFRARLTAKPWRIGIGAPMKPRRQLWPVSEEKMSERTSWIARYESIARGYAACAFVEEIGSGIVHPEVRRVVELHDELSGALRALPLA